MESQDQTLRAALRAALSKAFSSVPGAVRKLYFVSLADRTPTGFTTHRRGGVVMPKPASLVIAQRGDDPGYYLLYLDEENAEMTDTYHTALDGAFAQANAEFDVERDEWSPIEMGRNP